MKLNLIVSILSTIKIPRYSNMVFPCFLFNDNPSVFKVININISINPLLKYNHFKTSGLTSSHDAMLYYRDR